ncbi:MAG: hypothetical protein IJE97_08965 [Thermoguttaceae bacterium]|nr:hypothetical protein [Thermoguttaceae bacterium]
MSVLKIERFPCLSSFAFEVRPTEIAFAFTSEVRPTEIAFAPDRRGNLGDLAKPRCAKPPTSAAHPK